MADEQRPKKGLLRKYEMFCGLFVFLAILVSMGEIILRVFFNTSYDFIIQASVWLTVWGLLLIGGPVLAEGGHVSINFIRNSLTGRPQWILDVFNTGTTLLYSIAVTVGGVMLVVELIQTGSVFPLYLPIPMWTVQIIVPISMAIFTYFAWVRFYRTLRRSRKAGSSGEV
jgi:TRAP-type C4-dicarboxylate transport system permease small subunit